MKSIQQFRFQDDFLASVIAKANDEIVSSFCPFELFSNLFGGFWKVAADYMKIHSGMLLSK